MEANIIPFDVWLGSMTEVAENRNKVNQGDCFTIKKIMVGHEVPIPDVNLAAMYKLIGCEYVIGINGCLNTDIPMWPEGINEDCTNIQTVFIKETGKFETVIVIDIDTIEDNECWKIFDPNTGEYHKYLAISVEPKFEFFISNDKPNFIEFITRSVASADIADGMAAYCQIATDSPHFRVMKLGEAQMEEMPEYFSSVTLSNVVKTAVVRYFNKFSNDLIHENMVDDILNIRVTQTEEEDEIIIFSIEVLGQLYLFTIEYKPDYELPLEE